MSYAIHFILRANSGIYPNVFHYHAFSGVCADFYSNMISKRTFIILKAVLNFRRMSAYSILMFYLIFLNGN